MLDIRRSGSRILRLLRIWGLLGRELGIVVRRLYIPSESEKGESGKGSGSFTFVCILECLGFMLLVIGVSLIHLVWQIQYERFVFLAVNLTIILLIFYSSEGRNWSRRRSFMAESLTNHVMGKVSFEMSRLKRLYIFTKKGPLYIELSATATMPEGDDQGGHVTKESLHQFHIFL